MKRTYLACIGVAVVMGIDLAVAEVWPGLNGGGGAANSSSTGIGTNLAVRWMARLDPQRRRVVTTPYDASYRSKNILVRDGEVALLTQGATGTDVVFFDAALGGARRSFSSTLVRTTKAEWNTTGIEGRDLRGGQFMLYWHTNGNIYCRSSGDGFQGAVLRASDGAVQPAIGKTSAANQSGYMGINDNSGWCLVSGGGHQGQQDTSFAMQDITGTLAEKRFSAPGATCNYFTWCGATLVDGDWVYMLGAATHPNLGWPDYNASMPTTQSEEARQWLGARVRGLKVVGQTPTAGNQDFINGFSVGTFNWSRTNAFVATDHDVSSAVKPWCLGRSNVFLVTESASWTTNDADVDFTQPMRLTALSRTNGAAAFDVTLGITGTGCALDKTFGYFGGGTSWRPQVAYADRTGSEGREYVSVLLPEAVFTAFPVWQWVDPNDVNSSLNTRLAVVDATARTNLWTYEYPHGTTTPVLALGMNTSTKQIIAGDALYVVYAKTATNLDAYISTNILSDLTLYVDRFALANGAKTSFQFPLGIQANTLQLDDLAAAGGVLYALVTYREWDTSSPYAGGAQVLVALGNVTPGNQAPVFTAAPSASPTTVSAPVLSVTLAAQATDPDGPVPALSWSPVTGPAPVRFSTNNVASATNVTATFQQVGTYVIECRASDGELSATSTVTVTVNQPLTTVAASVPDSSASEPGSDAGYFTITRNGGNTNIPMTVYYTLGGTASNGTDYVAIPTGSVTLAAGVASTNLVITALDDAIAEAQETVTLTLATDPALNYKLGTTSTFTITINDNDLPTYTVVIGAYSNTVAEGSAGSVQIVRNGTINPLTVFYGLGGSASNGIDYGPLNGSVTIANGSSNAVIDLGVVVDALYESNETVVLTLTAGTNYGVGASSTATVTLVDASPMRVVWDRNQADALWTGNYWTDAVSQANGTNLPRQIDNAWIGDATIDTRIGGANMAPVVAADLDVGWRLDTGNADNGNLNLLEDGYAEPLHLQGYLRLANGSNCSARVLHNGGSVTVDAGIRLACGAGYGPWSYEIYGGQLQTYGDLLIGDLGPAGANFDNASASPGRLVVGGDTADAALYIYDGRDYRVNAGALGEPARTNIVATNGYVEIYGNMQIGGSYVLTSEGSVMVGGALELGKCAARSNTVINVQGGTFTTALLDMDEPGEAQFNLSGGTVYASALQIRSGVNNRIRISRTGVLNVALDNHEGLTYSVADAEADIAAGRITSDRPLNVTDDGSLVVIFQPPAPQVSVVAIDGAASESPLDTGVFTIQRAGDTSSVVVVSYALGGTATMGSDYTLTATGSVTLAAGVSSTNIVVTPVNDSAIEDDETVSLMLLGGATYDVGTPSQATVVIASDDGYVGAVSVTASDSAANENPADPGQFTVSRTNALGALNVNYAMSGTASNGVDYTALAGRVRLEDGESNAVVTVTPLDDSLLEAPETAVLTLLPGSRYTPAASATATVTIASDDVPAVTLAGTADAVESGGVQGAFVCTRTGSGSGLTSTALTVFYTVAGTASNGVDYTALPGAVVISNGQTTATVKVVPVADGAEEGSESVVLSLSPAGTYSIGAPSNGTIAILDRTPFYAVRNGRFNASDVDTWGKGLGVYPTNAGEMAYITNWTVTASNVGEVAAGVVVNLSGSGSSTGVLWLADPGPASSVMNGVTVNVNSGGVYRIVTDNNVSNSTTVLNGGTLAFAGGSLVAGVLNVNADSLITPVSSADVKITSVVHGRGKLTLTTDTAYGSACAFAAGSDWSGAWDIRGNIRFKDTTTARSVPGDVRVAPGKDMRLDGSATLVFKGVRSGSGTNTVYLGSTVTIGGTGRLSPGEPWLTNDVGSVVITSFSAGNYGPLLIFSNGSTYVVDVQSTAVCDRVTVAGAGTGTGRVTIAAGAALTVRLWTPTNSVTLDSTIIDTAMGNGSNGSNGLLTGAFGTVNWSNATGWTALMVTNAGNDLHVMGSYVQSNPDANTNGIPDSWETQYFGSTTDAQGAAEADWDGDGLSNYGEWVAGTNPTNDQSVLVFSTLEQSLGAATVLRWTSESNRFYTLKLSTNLMLDLFGTVLTNRMPGAPPVNVYTDAINRSPGAFYRITVEDP